MEVLDVFIMPQQFKNHLEDHEIVELENVTILESCHDERHEVKGIGYTTQHEILHVVSGKCTLIIGGKTVRLNDGQSILIPKHTLLEYHKTGSPYQSLLFFLRDEFILEFLQNHPFKRPWQQIRTPFVVFEGNEMLNAAFLSMRPYIRNASGTGRELFKVKTYELLLHLANNTESLPDFLSNMAKPSKIDLKLFMEKMYGKKIDLQELSALSGRSLSSFKREFKQIFGTSPSKWIKEKRLRLARELIIHTGQRPTEVYLDVGFEDYSHFSKSYKSYFGYLPSNTPRQQVG